MNQTEEYDLRIITGAAELFRQFGIRAVTMDMIASHLGMSKRTIYERFRDKDELLFAVMDSMIGKRREKTDTILDSSPDVISAIFAMIRTGTDHAAMMNPLIGSDLRKYHSKVLRRLKEKCENPDHEASMKILEAGVRQSVFRDNLNLEILSRAFSAIVSMIIDENLFPPEKFLQRDLIRNIILNFLRGISTARGIGLIDSMEHEI
ncbi:MAG: helix-turn-helix domain containing protein [Bacteroidales bacterium]|nr:helix-turn-helix domain containing protein [Bacteroidales bacterium]